MIASPLSRLRRASKDTTSEPESLPPVAGRTADWRMAVPTDAVPIARSGLKSVGITLLVFFLWGMLFPLASSVVAIGTVTPAGQAKVVQHPAGGVVKDIVANDGAFLEKGALIARIEPAIAKAELAGLLARRSLLEAQDLRLRAMKAGAAEFAAAEPVQLSSLRGTSNGTGQLAAEISVNLTSVMEEQRAEFSASRDRLAKEISGLEKQRDGLAREQFSLTERLRQHRNRLALVRNQLHRVQPLADAGYVAKARLWEIEAQVAELEGIGAQLTGELAAKEASLGETVDRIEALKSAAQEDVSRERSTILAELAAINQQVRAAELAVEYNELRAPVSGTLAKMQITTIGAVVEAGAAIAEIIPQDAQPRVEARIAPADIGAVRVGQETELVITSFNRRIADPLRGKVTYVAANSAIDERTGEPYFTVRIEPETASPKTLQGQQLTAGMQANVYIQTGSRSFFSWLLAPVFDSLRKAFNEA